MSYNGSGVFVLNTTGLPVSTATVISSTMFTAFTNDVATGLTTAYTKDGQSTPTANLPMGGFKLTGVALATTTGDALSYGRAANVTALTCTSLITGLTGLLFGNGASAVTAATAGVDYAAPGTAATWTALQTFNGTSSVLALKLANAKEPITISATAATGTIAFDITTQSILYYTTNASANWTMNFRASAGTTLNAAMSTGEVVTVVFLAKQGSPAFFNNVVQVDGTAVGVTTMWQSGAPTAGTASGVDSYTYAITKTGAAAFTVFASQTPYA